MIRHRDSSPAAFTRAVATCLAASLVLFAARPVLAGDAVLVLPRTPAAAVDGVDAALRSAGHRPRDAADLRAQLIAEDHAAQSSAAAALASIEQDLAAARAAWLAQRPADMLAALDRAERSALAVLEGGPACAATLWEIEFQLGLAYTTRNQPGDLALARARYALALALDPARRPVTALYGPDVGLAFIKVVDELALRPPRPVRLAVAPSDAVVTVDCHELPAALRPGLHAVRVAAPGHTTRSGLTELGDDAELRASLSADPSAPLGPWWTRGLLDPERPSARAAVEARVGAIAVVWLDTTPAPVARLMLAGQLRRVARADTAADAALQVLASPARPPPAKPPRRRTALALGITGAVLGGLALGLGLGLGLRDPREPHLVLVAP
jgi:hypothetical protein